MKKNQSERNNKTNSPEQTRRSNRQGVDRAPGEERGQAEKVRSVNLKGKKVDADPSQQSDRPVNVKREK
jgi:hypothetical protein